MHSRVGAVAKLLFVDLAGSVIRFPFWWYGTGLKRVILAMGRNLKYRARSYAFTIWMRNFFVPMYGQYDLTGRLVSVFMRFVILIGRFIAYIIEAIMDGFGILAWMAAPLVILFFFLTNLGVNLSVL